MKKDIKELKIKMIGMRHNFEHNCVDVVLNSDTTVMDFEIQSHTIMKICKEQYDAYEDVVFYVKKTNYALDRVSLQKVFLYISKFRTDHIIERYNLNINEVV